MDHLIEAIGIVVILVVIVFVALVATGVAGISYQNTATKKGWKFGSCKDKK